MSVERSGSAPARKPSQKGLHKIELREACGDDAALVGFTAAGSEAEQMRALPADLRERAAELFQAHTAGRDAQLVSGEEMKRLIVENALVPVSDKASARELNYMVDNAARARDTGSLSVENIDLDTFLSVLASLVGMDEPHDATARARNAFRSLDPSQRNGKITHNELPGIIETLDTTITETVARQMFDELDVERTGRIDYQLFIDRLFSIKVETPRSCES
mmetsp:Transcript_9840/g.26211  ORF Transcript_9840/g.26211 Transcript_9840/m.26211 type:complete len:221 (-) Transcript_9840:808-1470(-)